MTPVSGMTPGAPMGGEVCPVTVRWRLTGRVVRLLACSRACCPLPLVPRHGLAVGEKARRGRVVLKQSP